MANQETTFNADLEDCIDICLECYRVCVETLQHCLRMGGSYAELARIRRLSDCVQISQVSADFMIRGSELHAETCAACAEICGRCAEDCATFTDDDQMQDCAEACMRCAQSCARMAGEPDPDQPVTQDL